MRRLLFVGPSLPDARHLVGVGGEIELHGPVAAGDLARCDLTAGDVVGIVDGYFHAVQAVRHGEIMALLSAGVHVIGAASMGALRAAELDRHGMTGVGRIYRAYRSGRIDGDDEVALMHGPPESGYATMSVPMVNIRALLAAAVESGLISPNLQDLMIKDLRSCHYSQRTWRAVERAARTAGLSAAATTRLVDSRVDPAVDVKRQDALELVRVLREAEFREQRQTLVFSETVLQHQWGLDAKGCDRGSVRDAVRVCQLFLVDFSARYHQAVLAHIANECFRECGTESNGSYVHTVLAHARHRGVTGAIRDFVRSDACQDWLFPGERESPAEQQAMLALVRSFRVVPGVIPEELLALAVADSDLFGRARCIAQAAREVNAAVTTRDPSFSESQLSETRITEWLAFRWNVETAHFAVAALDRGFPSRAAAVASARKFYLLVKYNEPVLACLEDGSIAPDRCGESAAGVS